MFTLDELSSRTITANGIIVTTKLHEIENENDNNDDDMVNVGFEKLPNEGNRFGLFILKIRERLVKMIEKEKVRKFCEASLR